MLVPMLTSAQSIEEPADIFRNKTYCRKLTARATCYVGGDAETR